MYNRFLFIRGIETLEEYLEDWGYQSMEHLYAVCSACDEEEWYEWVKKQFNYVDQEF